ncbi:MAG: hypothetical protein KAK04_16405 [Cyclobacteriaceae bacterium]|nr:hypothetical protein [Cyclobacteriaceae bacterium]
MSSEEIKKDPYIKSIFDEGGIEQPSSNFTNQIIKNIKAQSEESAFVYKPIISKTAWLVLAFLGLSLFVYLLFGSPAEGQGLNLYGYTLNIDTSIIKGIFNKIAFSFELSPILKTSLIALTFFTFTNLLIFEIRSRSFFK